MVPYLVPAFFAYINYYPTQRMYFQSKSVLFAGDAGIIYHTERDHIKTVWISLPS
jgi:hypothetical protein